MTDIKQLVRIHAGSMQAQQTALQVQQAYLAMLLEYVEELEARLGIAADGRSTDGSISASPPISSPDSNGQVEFESEEVEA